MTLYKVCLSTETPSVTVFLVTCKQIKNLKLNFILRAGANKLVKAAAKIALTKWLGEPVMQAAYAARPHTHTNRQTHTDTETHAHTGTHTHKRRVSVKISMFGLT